MLIKYALYAIQFNSLFEEKFDKNESFFIMTARLYFTLGTICHWAYASQYLKTCILLPNMVSKARLLLERYQNAIENNCTKITLHSEFVNRDIAIDTEMKFERARNKKVSANFLKVDILLSILMLGTEAFLLIMWEQSDEKSLFWNVMLFLFPPILDAIVSIILVFSACYLANQVK